MAKINKKKYYGSLATIAVVGGVSVLIFFLVKKPKLRLVSVDKLYDNDEIVSKKYNIRLGLRDIELELKKLDSNKQNDEIKINLPLYTYHFKASEIIDEDGFNKVDVHIKNKVNGKETNYVLQDN